MKRSQIVLIKSGYQDIYPKLKRALEFLAPLKLQSNNTVIIKINLCDARTPETGTITHPLFLDATLHYLRENFGNLKIYVVESDATVALADEFVKWFGFVPILEKWSAEFVNLSKTRVLNRKISGRYFREIPIPEILEEADFFITIPKPKTNPIATITCCLKNQFGCLPIVEKNIYHPHLDDAIADVNKAIPPDLCLVDGVIAVGGCQGPSFGVPIPLKAIMCSKDPVAVDAFCARLMGFNPWFIGHIRKSASSGVGSSKYSLVGDDVREFRVDFEISKFEWRLLKLGSFLQKRAQRQFRAAQGRT